MTKKSDLLEQTQIGTGVVNQLLRIPNNGNLTYGCGLLLSNQLWFDPLFGFPAAFAAARIAGATYVQIDTIRSNTATLTPVGVPGQQLQSFIIYQCLIQLPQILAATTFVSRQDIDAALTKINFSFDHGIEIAANDLNNTVYQALIQLHAASVQDLSNRADILPRMISFNFSAALPSLYLSQRIYGVGNRAKQIVDENKVQHPLFCPQTIIALSQ